MKLADNIYWALSMSQKLLYLILMILPKKKKKGKYHPSFKRRKSLWVITCQVTRQVNDTAGMKTPAMTISWNLLQWPADPKVIESLCIMKSSKYVRLSLKTRQITQKQVIYSSFRPNHPGIDTPMFPGLSKCHFNTCIFCGTK